MWISHPGNDVQQVDASRFKPLRRGMGSPATYCKDKTVKSGRPETGWQWVRLVGNFANLTTPLGLAVAGMGGATIKRGPRGLFLGEGYRFGFPVAGAFTVGNVITTS